MLFVRSHDGGLVNLDRANKILVGPDMAPGQGSVHAYFDGQGSALLYKGDMGNCRSYIDLLAAYLEDEGRSETYIDIPRKEV